MCGIAGIVTSSSWKDSLQQALSGLQRDLIHRGPDDLGLWLSPGGGAGFVHTRLAILDLSPAGHQPMSSPDGRFHITFNGEIYNFQELRAALERDAPSTEPPFHSRSDTEVLLRLFAREGPAMLERLRGMFAFAIWDELEQSLFLARDPFGIKPLYHTVPAPDRPLAFASELRALRRSTIVSPALDPAALTAYFESGSVPEPRTLLLDVRLLPAGHSALWSRRTGQLTVTPFWKPRFPAPTSHGQHPIENPAAHTRAALVDSLRAHLVSDVPVGLFLSGGIDSTVLAALAREAGAPKLSTFAVGVDDPSRDESAIARRTAQQFETDHHELRLNASTAEAIFHQFLQHLDQPSIDGMNTFTVASFARDQGMKVVLSGLGGDELFAGYPSFNRVPRLASYARWASRLPGFGPIAGALLTQPSHRPQWRRLGALLGQPPSLTAAYHAFRGVFTPAEARQLASRYLDPATPLPNAPADPPFAPAAADELDAVSECELCLYMRNQLLRDSDIMSMARGLELRLPFVDQVLFDQLAPLPASTRLRPGKALLLEAVPEVPDWVANQPKRGFLFPYEEWLRTRWGNAFSSIDQRLPGSHPAWYQRWSVFMLEHWLQNP